MSKLADAIKKSQRVESTPMGFGPARAASKHVEIVPVVHSPSPRLRRFPVHYNAVLGERGSSRHTSAA